MNLLPHEAAIIRRFLAGPAAGAPPPDPAAELSLLLRMNEEAPPLGAHVFQIVCKLGSDATKEVAANTKERKALREQLGKKRLGKGEGPARVAPLMAATMNEYNALDPWRKEAIRKAFDQEIERLKTSWPAWWCGSLDRTVVVKTKEKRVREGGRRRAVLVTRESSLRPDELALDTIGAKIPLDRLVQAGVLRGDSPQWLARFCEWKRAAPGEGRVIVDVYEIAAC